jgi:hypothetical protein
MSTRILGDLTETSRQIDIKLQIYVSLIHNRGQFMLDYKQRTTGGTVEGIPVFHQ